MRFSDIRVLSGLTQGLEHAEVTQAYKCNLTDRIACMLGHCGTCSDDVHCSTNQREVTGELVLLHVKHEARLWFML